MVTISGIKLPEVYYICLIFIKPLLINILKLVKTNFHLPYDLNSFYPISRSMFLLILLMSFISCCVLVLFCLQVKIRKTEEKYDNLKSGKIVDFHIIAFHHISPCSL